MGFIVKMHSVTLKDLSKDWLKLTADYRPSAFWFWNSTMEPESIKQNIVEMHRNGIREILIHPIHGMDIEYLSADYFERYRYVLSTARKCGLRVWIYDEYGWPSGNAGGKLLEQYPEYKAWFLRLTKTSQGAVTVQPFLSDRILDNAVGASWTKNTNGYLNTLSKEAVQCFIRLTHQRYYEECGDFFRDVVAGFFTDEPVMMVGCVENQREVWNTTVLPWTPELPTLFKQKFGYDIDGLYEKLACPNEFKIKKDYWDIIKNLHIEAYHNQISNWCHKHGVKYTGHIGENVPLMQVRFSGSPFMSLATMDEPGVDMLTCEPHPEQQFLEQVLVSSITKHAEPDRTYCEAFGAAPFSIRLGQMLRSIQMLGIHGVNDIALMGFHESLDGVRKRMYWPPLFKTAPWWSFYPVFRDICARSVGLTSLGKIKTRYAILYPQHQLEQNDIFMDVWATDEPVLEKLTRLGTAIYQAGETFEFVFPENLANARIIDDSITLGKGTYSEFIAPGDLMYSQNDISELSRLLQEGGQIEQSPTNEIIDKINTKLPSWKQLIEIECHDSKSYRIYEFKYLDGSLFAVKNISDKELYLSVKSDLSITEWDTIIGNCIDSCHKADFRIEPDGTTYFSVSSKSMGYKSEIYHNEIMPMETKWSISSTNLNMARFLNVQFYHEELGWLNPEPNPSEENISAEFIPVVFKGRTSIKMRGSFYCDFIPTKLGVVYEQKHFSDLIVNGQSVRLDNSYAFVGWDTSCRYVEISSFSRSGNNIVEGTLHFEKFETSLFSHGFFRGQSVMPTCDICVAGTFKFLGKKIVGDNNDPFKLPVDLGQMGWSQYSGRISIIANIEVSQNLSNRLCGLEFELASEDALEVFWDGNSIGQGIARPYKFRLYSVMSGLHELKLVIAGTSGNILDRPSPWGVTAGKWLLSHRNFMAKCTPVSG